MANRKSYLIDIKEVREDDGCLLVIETNGNPLPFEVKRIFWIRDVPPGVRRGEHANKITKLVLVAVTGSCDVEVDDGRGKKVYHMDNPAKGLYIDEMIWRSMRNFSSDCVLMAICDHAFVPGEAYDDYDEFQKALLGET